MRKKERVCILIGTTFIIIPFLDAIPFYRVMILAVGIGIVLGTIVGLLNKILEHIDKQGE